MLEALLREAVLQFLVEHTLRQSLEDRAFLELRLAQELDFSLPTPAKPVN